MTTSTTPTYVVVAHYRVQPTQLDDVVRTLETVARLTRQEPGCLEFRVHRAVDEEDHIVLYEEYRSAADFEAHCATEHFTTLILGEVVPRLASRERAGFDRLV